MQLNERLNPEDRIAAALSQRYASQSRRSFLYRLTKASFAVLGVSLAGEMPLFVVPDVSAGPPAVDDTTGNWLYCGLNGTACSTGCTAVASPSYSWTTCCSKSKIDPKTGLRCCTVYFCVTYTDICAKTTPAGCTTGYTRTPTGGGVTTGIAWCTDQTGEAAVESGVGGYTIICTLVSVAGGPGGSGWASASDCAKKCGPHTLGLKTGPDCA
jgi:hypothetical protein